MKPIMGRLKIWDIGANHLTEQGLYDANELFRNNCCLQNLNFTYNKFRDPALSRIAAEYLSTMTSLRVLNLKMCRITDDVLSSLMQTFHIYLKTLNLSYNRITKDGIKVMKEYYEKTAIAELEELDLSNNELNDFAIEDLSKIMNTLLGLKTLDIRENLFINRYQLARDRP